MKKMLLVTPLLLLALAACSSGNGEDKDDDRPSTNPTAVGTADLKAVKKRWEALTGDERKRVCSQVHESGGPDYRDMQTELQRTGLTQPQAAEMLPSAVNWC
ncbi:hypothetical protein OHU25_51300 [Streptomyces sp. NBC_00117]|uniref:hypothetical protein n=1 Tax=Streptomyces sp. NBC_00117 TaxID=2975657 RepID=UPI0032523EF6